jgi:formate/nitrite transporter
VKIMSDIFKPPEIAKALSDSCVTKVKCKWTNLAILGFLAGAFIAFGAELSIMSTVGTAAVLGTGLTKVIAGSVFSVGLILVVIAGAELWTGNNLMVISTCDKKFGISSLLYNWSTVFSFNFIGAVFIALTMWGSGLWKTGDFQWGITATTIAVNKVNLSFVEAFLRGIGCNWLVCLAVWIAVSSKDTIGKIFGIFFPIMAFVASGFEHIIANMFFIPMGLFLKNEPSIMGHVTNIDSLTWGNMITNNFIPVTLGNLVGGAFFVGFLYWWVYLKKDKNDKK